MRQLFFTAVIIALLSLLAFLGWKSWQQAEAYEAETFTLIQQLTASSKLEESGMQLLEMLSFGLYDEYSRHLQQLHDHQQRRLALAESVKLTMMAFAIASLILFITVWAYHYRWFDVAYAMLAVALIALVVGLSSPILSIEASQELPVLGETVLQYQSKGILSTLSALYENGYWWLAVVLFLFSVIIPVTKTVIGGLTMFDQSGALLNKWFHISHHMGKWSMADVFVVAILVAYFANSGADTLTHAEVRSGLWFFLCYVLLSLLAFQMIGRKGRQQAQNENEWSRFSD